MKSTLLFQFLIISLFCSAQHGMLYPISIEEQVEASSLIVEGVVTDRQSVWNNSKNLIYTLNTISVFKTFIGECQSTITIITAGGRVGNHVLQISESLQLKEGDLGVFILKPHSKFINGNENIYDVVSDLQGFYKYDIINNTARNPFQSFTGIDTVFYNHLLEQTNAPITRFQEIEYKTKNQSKSVFKTAATISPLSISAGTESVVTISGEGFGSIIGTVEFKWADDGGVTFQPALTSQIVSWTDTEIKVEVPTFAGTGTIRITDAASNSQETSSVLTITFAQSNGESFGDAVLSNLIDVNSLGGYTWHMFTDFDSNQPAKSEFLQALSTWRCSSNINWRLGAVTTNDSSVVDGENVIRFDKGNELPLGVLGRCATYSFLCGTPPVNAAVEMDMTIDDDTEFHYGTGIPQEGQYDFQSVVVHELGHGHQLNHVIDSNDIMYYALADGVIRRTLGANDIAGSSYVQNRCMAANTCQFEATTALDCNVGINEQTKKKSIKVYPNPASTQFYIDGDANQKISLYNLTGVNMPVIPIHQDGKWLVKLKEIPNGLYLVKMVDKQGLTSFGKVFVK